MKLKSIIITTLALAGLAGNASADTNQLSATDGWEKITTVPSATDIANHYYVFVDNTNDLMLGIAKGVHQDTKWYSLGAYYQTSVSPFTSDILSKTWTLESQGNGFAMRNLEYSVSLMQTEWDAPWKFDTNDVYENANDWTEMLFSYTGSYWIIQNGYYPDSGYLGPWDDSNFADGAECAANKSGNNVGKFQIYAISREKFKQNLLDNASASNPVDITPWYVTNATFDHNNRNGWTEEGSDGNNNTAIGCEIWHRTGFNIYQTLTLPNGKYKVSIQAAGSTSGTVYGTSGNTTQTATTTANASNNFQNTVLAMIQNRSFGQIITPEITVSNGSLTIGFKDNTSDQWDVFDNFKVYCTDVDLSGYAAQLAALVNEANDFINCHCVPAACEDIISDAIDTYNQTYDTGKEYSAAILALSNVLNTYKNNAELQSAYAAYYSFKNHAENLTVGVEDGNTKTTFINAVSTITSDVEAATAAAAINTQKANLRSATMTFISTTEGSFDITFLASQVYSDWKKKDGSPAGEATWAITNKPSGFPSFAESYEETCATTGNVLYQTVSDLPEGYYQVGMYAQANYTPGRGFSTQATEGDANRSFAFANDLRTGIPILFATEVDFADLTTLDVNVHLTQTGDLTFGIQKDMNGSNWHFAQIASIVYSKDPDLTGLQATRDALVAEATGILNGSEAVFLTAEQKAALQAAIDAGNAANTFETLNTVTLTTLPEAINTAKSQIAAVKTNRVLMVDALERFERDYNLADGTDYSRLTMSAEAWETLIEKVNAVSEALDDIAQATNYGSLKDALIAQMDATDGSLRLFKSYKAMVDGTTDLGLATESDDQMDSDETEQNAIATLNGLFTDFANTQSKDFCVNGFLGDNLDFNTEQGAALVTGDNIEVFDIAGWEESYKDIDAWTRIKNNDNSYQNQLFLRSNWTDKAVTLNVFKEKMLPVGKYRLSFKWNCDMNNMTNLSHYKLGETTVTVGKASAAEETLTYDFEVTDAATPFDLVFGFQKQNSGNTPAQILVDDVELTCTRIVDDVCDYFVIEDKKDLSIENSFTATTLVNTRTLAQSEDAYTVCLPYALTSNEDVQFYEFSSVSKDGVLHFNEVDVTEPLKPYLAVAKNDASLNAENVEVSATIDPMPNVTVGNYTLMGTMTNISREEAIGLNAYILQSGNKWRKVDASSGANVTIPAFRAYIVAANGAVAPQVVVFNVGTATGIESFVKQEQSDAVYDLQGRKWSARQMKPGIYVVNGKKVIK